MSVPVQLSDLPVASSATDSDLTLLRKGLTDYQCAVELIRQINIAAFDILPNGYANATDLFMIARAGSNYQIQFSQVGFLKGTKMYFYGAAPTGWSIVPGTGDKLLAVSDLITKYATGTPGTQQGTWQQHGVGGGVPGGGLSVAQLPPHQHYIPTGKSSTGETQNPQLAARGKTIESPKIVTDNGSSNGLQGQPHNHGNSWRPAANVGCIAVKDL